MNHIPLEHYLKAIPKLTTGLQKDGSAKVETGIKFNAIYKLFQKNRIEGGRNRNKVFLDLQYYCELGHFFKKQHQNEQPQFYQTNNENYDYFEEELKPLLAKKFKSISDNWQKLDKKKLVIIPKRTISATETGLSPPLKLKQSHRVRKIEAYSPMMEDIRLITPPKRKEKI